MRRPTHETCAALAAAIDAYVEKAEGEDLGRMLERAGYIYVPETMQDVQALEDKVSGILSRSMLDRLRELQAAGGFNWLGILTAAIDGDPNMRGASADQYVQELYEALRDAFLSLMPKLVMGYSAKIDDKLAIEGITKRTLHFVDGWSRELAEKMQLTTEQEIKRILDKALRDGDSVETVTQEIINAGIRERSKNKSNPLRTDWRARRVALTEMLRAHSYAQLDAYRQNPAVTGKRWMHTAAKFSTARPAHVDLNGKVVDVNGVFDVNGHSAQCPRDTSLPASESVNCHCLIQPVVDENILGLPLEERDRMWKEAVDNDNGAWRREVELERMRESLKYNGVPEEDWDAKIAEWDRITARQEDKRKKRIAEHEKRAKEEAEAKKKKKKAKEAGK